MGVWKSCLAAVRAATAAGFSSLIQPLQGQAAREEDDEEEEENVVSDGFGKTHLAGGGVAQQSQHRSGCDVRNVQRPREHPHAAALRQTVGAAKEVPPLAASTW
jgi:hypothetical protein